MKNALITTSTEAIPYPAHALIAAGGQRAAKRFVEFFTANIRNPNTRAAYLRAVLPFSDWCDARGLTLEKIEPVP